MEESNKPLSSNDTAASPPSLRAPRFARDLEKDGAAVYIGWNTCYLSEWAVQNFDKVVVVIAGFTAVLILSLFIGLLLGLELLTVVIKC